MLSDKIKICHLTSAHQRFDVRIFHKECCSLAQNGYDVNLIVADGKGDEKQNNVNIIDVGKENGRIKRMIFSAYKVYKKAVFLNANIYHFHDPELLQYAYLLSLRGKRIIYDAHEDLPKQILTKPYLNSLVKKIFSFLIKKIESFFANSFSGVIGATPFITEKFITFNPNVINVNNYPIVEESVILNQNIQKEYDLVYIGHISKLRGFNSIVNVSKELNLSLAIAGVFSPASLQEQIKDRINISYLGYLNNLQTFELLKKSKIGLVLLSPTESYVQSLPVKMFEYLLAGIPVVASDFPLWKEIIQENNCGICVNPESSNEIAAAIEYLIQNQDIAKKMGENGKKMILSEYNWNIEEKKMLSFYKKILP